jgi:hypothetical protein
MRAPQVVDRMMSLRGRPAGPMSSAAPGRRSLPAAAVATLTLLVVAALGAAGAHAGSPPAARPLSARPLSARTFPTPIQHVIVIMEENEISANVFKHGPFEVYLAHRYAYANQYYGVCHPSSPNYLAITGGSPLQQCGTDAYNVYNSENIFDLAQKAGLSWYDFSESMPQPCYTKDTFPSGLYVAHHNPAIFYQDIVDNPALCNAHDLPLSSWYSLVNSSQIPNFAFIAPNMNNDGHQTNVSFADHWLQNFLGPYLNASWMQSTAFFVTWDEGMNAWHNDNSGYNGTDGGKVYFAAISPWARANYTLSSNACHYDLASTIEWLLGLPSTGHNDSAQFPALESIFNLSGPSGGGGGGSGGWPWSGWSLGLSGGSEMLVVGGVLILAGVTVAILVARRFGT